MKLIAAFFLIIFILTSCGKKSEPQYQGKKGQKVIGSNTTAGIKGNFTRRVSGNIIERHKQIGTNPEDAIALWVEAAVLAQENNDEGWEGLSELTLPLRKDPIWRKKDAHHYFLKKLKDPNSNCFKSMIMGTSPENGYAFNYDEIAVEVTRQAGEDSNGHKYFVLSSGADTPRPIHLKKSNKTDLWYINAYSSFYVDVQPSIDLNAERFE